LVHPLTSRHPRSGSPVLSLLSKPCIFMAEELNNVSTAVDITFSFIEQTKEQIRCAECPRWYQPSWEQTSSGICTVTLPLSLPFLHTENWEFVLQYKEQKYNSTLLLKLPILAYTLLKSILLSNFECSDFRGRRNSLFIFPIFVFYFQNRMLGDKEENATQTECKFTCAITTGTVFQIP